MLKHVYDDVNSYYKASAIFELIKVKLELSNYNCENHDRNFNSFSLNSFRNRKRKREIILSENNIFYVKLQRRNFLSNLEKRLRRKHSA